MARAEAHTRSFQVFDTGSARCILRDLITPLSDSGKPIMLRNKLAPPEHPWLTGQHHCCLLVCLQVATARYAWRSRINVAIVALLLSSLSCRPNLGSIRTVENDVRSCSFVSATMARCQSDLTKSFHDLGLLDVPYTD